MFELSHPSLIHIQFVADRTGRSFYVIPNIIGGIDAIDVDRTGLDEDCFPLGIIRPKPDYYNHPKDLAKSKKIFQSYRETTSNIKNPVDMKGNMIRKGDHLTWNFGETTIKPSPWMLSANFAVNIDDKGNFYGKSLFGEYLLPDCEFANCLNLTLIAS